MFREFLDEGLEKGWPESLSKEQSQITLFKSPLIRSRTNGQKSNYESIRREVPNGVGADGVGVKFPIFPVNCSRLLLFQENRKKTKRNEEKRRKTKKNEEKRKSEEKAKKKRRKTKKTKKMGKFLRPHLHQPH